MLFAGLNPLRSGREVEAATTSRRFGSASAVWIASVRRPRQRRRCTAQTLVRLATCLCVGRGPFHYMVAFRRL